MSSQVLRSYFFSFLLGIFIGPVFAQTLAPDFTLTDTDSVEWNLYEQLEQGKTVVLDFFYATCTPCQTWTPEIIQMYADYGGGTGEVLVLGISDRDDNAEVEAFEDSFNVTYPSGGIDGGGDDITSLYSSWFPFFGWPTYAVICPDKTVTWNLPKNPGLPELRAKVDTCEMIPNGILEKESFSATVMYPIPAFDYLNVKIAARTHPPSFELYSIIGNKIPVKAEQLQGDLVRLTFPEISTGTYILRILIGDNDQKYYRIPIIKTL
ncbi:MAG: redoxin domain-containing protein [Bacteroidetes bacterium]|nr:redoxin domain-containing protein [Bacteroidota bacterium]